MKTYSVTMSKGINPSRGDEIIKPCIEALKSGIEYDGLIYDGYELSVNDNIWTMTAKVLRKQSNSQ